MLHSGQLSHVCNHSCTHERFHCIGRGNTRVWQGLLCDDAEKTDHSAVLAGAPAINSRRFQELQESNTPNSVPSKLGCRCNIS